jgi:hypothetical protein
VNGVEIELRDYRIRHGQMDAWIAGWKSAVVPLREKAGFHLIGAWVDRQNDRFIWLIGYAGDGDFETANNRYYGSDKRVSLQPNPADLVEEAKAVKVETVV